MINPDILLERQIRRIKRRVKLISDTWDRRFDEDDEEEYEYEEEF